MKKGVPILSKRELKELENLRHNFNLDVALDKYEAILKYKIYYNYKLQQAIQAENRMLKYLKGKEYKVIKK